jgi:hypothetical protein
MDDAETPPSPPSLPRYDAMQRDQPTVPVTLPAPDAAVPVPPPMVARPLGVMPWSPDDPRNYKLVRNTGLMIAGIGIFGGMWSLSAVGSLAWGPYLAIPIAGPWVIASQLSGDRYPPSAGMAALFVLDGALQLAGATMLVVGAVTHHRKWNPPVAFAPVARRDYAGASLAFRF